MRIELKKNRLNILAMENNLRSQVMDIMKRVAEKNGMVAVLHEKPLAGVNGSGKHFNFSIGDDTGENYFEPTGSPSNNTIFLLSLGAIFLGVNKYGGLLRAAVADAGNDHRLGANEAPPAIISIYLGEYLDKLMNEIEGLGKITEEKISDIYLGLKDLPKVAKDSSDRNRTSPLAFTGNKFEFRAVGSSHNCAEAATVMNMIMAYGYNQLADRIEKKKGSGSIKQKTFAVLEEVIRETKRVRFEANNYDQKWHKEAAKRGLPNTKNTPEALALFLDKEAIALYEQLNVLTEKEVHSKIEIKLEAYAKTKDIECKTAINIAKTLVLPAIARQIAMLGNAQQSVKSAGVKATVLSNDIKIITKVYDDVQAGSTNLEKVMAVCAKQLDMVKAAKGYATSAASALEKLRFCKK